MTIGDRIVYRRIELNMSQTDLAKKAGYCDKAAVSRLEHSGNKVTMKQVKRLADALDCSMAYLMGWEESEDVKEALANAKKDEEHEQPKAPAEGTVSVADVPRAMDLFAKYQNASKEVQMAVDLLLKSQQQDALSQRLQDYNSGQTRIDS